MSQWKWKRRSPDSREISTGAGRSRGRKIEIAAAAVGILTGGFLLGGWVVGSLVDLVDGDEEEIRLEIAERTVSSSRDTYLEARQDSEAEPTIAATVRNQGDETAWIEEARITVVEEARLGACVTQGGGEGDVPRTKDYRVVLPEYPRAGRQVLRRDLHAEVQPGHGVRPVLTFKRNGTGTLNLYAVAVEFVADPGGQVHHAGRFVIGVPDWIVRGGTIFPENEELLDEYVGPGDAAAIWCFRHNLEALRRVLAEPGERPAEIAALDHMQPAPGWSAYAGHAPGPLVVEELLGSEDPEAVLHAIEAAGRSGDRSLERETRRRAVAILLREGRRSLDRYPPYAEANAERVLSLGRSAAASALLWRARAAISAEEGPAEAG